ncbi:MAG: hypothetical protein WD770_06170 [Actinomycetota bacterium]
MSMFTPMTFNSRPRTWLMITAVFELFLAAIFIVVGLAVPVLRGGFLLTGIILGVVGFGLLAWGAKMGAGIKEAQRLRAVGMKGQGRIVNAGTTGTTLNDNPLMNLELEITIPGKTPYRVHHKTWVPLVMMGTMTMGVTLPVIVDPADPSKILIEWEQGPTFAGPAVTNLPGGVQVTQTQSGAGQGLGALGALGAAALGGLAAAQAGGGQVAGQTSMSVSLSQQQEVAERLQDTGVTGQATITSAQDTGVALQGQRLFVIDVVVNVPGRAPVVAQQPAMVPEASASKVVQGATLPVKVDATDSKVFAIDWS